MKPLFSSKVEISNIIYDFKNALKAISLVHFRGAMKYKKYQWLNDPFNCNSSPMNNIDALYRHFISHTMGKIWDIEGLPHIFHMACRAGMYISTIYRLHLRKGIDYYDADSIVYYRYFNDDIWPFGMFITPEEIYSLSKYNRIIKDHPEDDFLKDPLSNLEIKILTQLLNLNNDINYEFNSDTDVTAITYQDILYVSIMSYVQQYIEKYRNELIANFSVELFPEQFQKQMNTHFLETVSSD